MDLDNEWKYVYLEKDRVVVTSSYKTGMENYAYVPPSIWKSGEESIKHYLAKVSKVGNLLDKLAEGGRKQ